MSLFEFVPSFPGVPNALALSNDQWLERINRLIRGAEERDTVISPYEAFHHLDLISSHHQKPLTPNVCEKKSDLRALLTSADTLLSYGVHPLNMEGAVTAMEIARVVVARAIDSDIEIFRHRFELDPTDLDLSIDLAREVLGSERSDIVYAYVAQRILGCARMVEMSQQSLPQRTQFSSGLY